MSYGQRHGFGRYWTAEKLCIQNMSRKIRHTICKDSMFDIEMKNAQPTLLSWYCYKHGINCGALEDYIKSREPMLQDLMNNRCITRDKVKKLLLAIINGKQINPQQADQRWFIDFCTGMRNILNAVVQPNPEMFKHARKTKHTKYNLNRSTINQMMCKLGNKALMAAFDYLNGKGIEVASLVFDGLLIYKKNVPDIAEILKGCSSSVDHVLKGCGIEFTIKEMDECYKIPGSTRNHQPTDIDILLQKGVYPYEYMNSFERLLETQLPPIEKFHSSLTDERISQKDYQHAQKVWESFSCETLGDYHDHYLKTDVFLLTDVFQTFRRTCKNAYKLHPLHYFTAPWIILGCFTQIHRY